MAKNGHTTLDQGFRLVRGLLAREVPFEHIEAAICDAGLSDEAESVLWLYAWCGGQARELREIVTAGEPPTA